MCPYVFYEFLLGPEAQKLFAALDYGLANTKVASPLKGLKFTLIELTVVLDERAKWDAIFDKTMAGK